MLQDISRLNLHGIQALCASNYQVAAQSFQGCLKLIQRHYQETGLPQETSHPEAAPGFLVSYQLPRPSLSEHTLSSSLDFFNRIFHLEGNESYQLSAAVAFYNVGASYHQMALASGQLKLCLEKATQSYALSFNILNRGQFPILKVGSLLLALCNNQAHLSSLSFEDTATFENMEKLGKILQERDIMHSMCDADLSFFNLSLIMFKSQPILRTAPCA